MRDLIDQGEFDAAHALLQEHILIINRSLALPDTNTQVRQKAQLRSDQECQELLLQSQG